MSSKINICMTNTRGFDLDEYFCGEKRVVYFYGAVGEWVAGLGDDEGVGFHFFACVGWLSIYERRVEVEGCGKDM
jgi:hypothetical protein